MIIERNLTTKRPDDQMSSVADTDHGSDGLLGTPRPLSGTFTEFRLKSKNLTHRFPGKVHMANRSLVNDWLQS